MAHARPFMITVDHHHHTRLRRPPALKDVFARAQVTRGSRLPRRALPERRVRRRWHHSLGCGGAADVRCNVSRSDVRLCLAIQCSTHIQLQGAALVLSAWRLRTALGAGAADTW